MKTSTATFLAEGFCSHNCHALSRFDKEPTAERYVVERDMGIQFLAYLRQQLPKVRIVFKEGNHEERLAFFFMRKAPELYELDVVQLPALMQFERFGVEFVGDRRLVRLGKLNVIHGHEYKPDIQSPVNAARGLFIRAHTVAMMGHLHQSSEHHEPSVTGHPLAAWSVGCACDLHPFYKVFNKWNWGFALVRVFDAAGLFEVRNLRVLDGKVV